MADRTQQSKSPVLASFLSIVPGCGQFYLGNLLKGIAHLLVFAGLITLANHAGGDDEVVFALMIAGFYIFQIFDTYRDAQRTRPIVSDGTAQENEEELSLFWAIAVLVTGVAFQLSNLELISLRQISRLWPLILIVLGVKLLVDYFHKGEK
jgi:TM2 domain-containing membrane protein YozV